MATRMAEESTDILTIPVVDISSKNSDAPGELLAAASKYGFAYIANNEAGIPTQSIKQMFDLARSFFGAPLNVKEEAAIASNEAGSNVGWLKQGVEKLDPSAQKHPDVKEALNIPASFNLNKQNTLPAPLLPHQETITSFQQDCHALCLRLLAHFAIALSLPSDWFTVRHDQSKGPSGTIFRLLYYPALPSTSKDTTEDIRAGAHSDYGSLTLLMQLPGQPGLQIRGPDGEWTDVPVKPPTSLQSNASEPLPILVNIGDLLEDWTGGLLKSTVHRVIFPGQPEDAGDRYSIAYFCHPLDDVLLEPVPSNLVREQIERKGSEGKASITARQHLMARLAATYNINGS